MSIRTYERKKLTFKLINPRVILKIKREGEEEFSSFKLIFSQTREKAYSTNKKLETRS